MRCPTCGGSGQIPDDALVTSRPSVTGGLAHRQLIPSPGIDRFNRIERAVNLLSRSDTDSKARLALLEWQKYLTWILDKGGKVSTSTLCTEYWKCESFDLAGRHHTMRSLARLIHRELDFTMLIEKDSGRGESWWMVTPFGEKIAKPTPVIDVTS